MFHKIDASCIIKDNLDLFDQLLPNFRVDAQSFEAQITFDRDNLLVDPLLKVGTLVEQRFEQLRREDLLVYALSEGYVRARTDHYVDAFDVGKCSN